MVRVYRRDPTGTRDEIRPSIVLASDDSTELEHFKWTRWNSADRLYAHIIQSLLPAPDTPESLVAWYATLEYASKFLAIGSPLGNLNLTGEPIVLTPGNLLESPSPKRRENGSNFICFQAPRSRVIC
jgi:hypothetical protein